MTKKNPQILILIGAPGSGKSSFAKYFLRTEVNWVRVCRDDFRTMQFSDSTMEQKIEGVMTGALESMIDSLLHKKMNVLIDATHCKKEYINQYITRFKYLADISFKVFDVPLDELEKRCAEREEKTGKHIPPQTIKRFYEQLEQLKKIFDFAPLPMQKRTFTPRIHEPTKPSCYLFDLDGTLADPNGRNMFSPTAEEVLNDIPIQSVITTLQLLEEKHTVIFLSGREDTNYASTKLWLEKYIYNGETKNINLYMRKAGDYRRDSLIKKEILHEHILPQYNVIAAFDDRLQVVRECWNAENIFCFNVNQYLEEF